jgi:acetoin utilization deacetylase AcuC-like enzyme
MSDAACPVSRETWDSICWSAWTAAHAARQLLEGESAVYALCRPPGHHAGSDLAGGFCYFNNSAIAVEILRKSFDRVAVVDIDLHHGNGTQSIFYRRADVMTFSIHADPSRFYPFFWGYADERGEGDGQGANLNIPLPRGSGDEIFLDALDQGLARVRDFSPDAVVVALGLDGFEGDPFGGLAISTAGFRTIGHSIASKLKVPTVLVQEGGYLCDELGDNLTGFLEGFGENSSA